MTTNVIIPAHCGKNKEVSVVITDKGEVVEKFTIQDQETAERAIYDGREISAKEIYKVTTEERESCFKHMEKRRVVCNGERCEHYNICFDK